VVGSLPCLLQSGFSSQHQRNGSGFSLVLKFSLQVAGRERIIYAARDTEAIGAAVGCGQPIDSHGFGRIRRFPRIYITAVKTELVAIRSTLNQ